MSCPSSLLKWFLMCKGHAAKHSLGRHQQQASLRGWKSLEGGQENCARKGGCERGPSPESVAGNPHSSAANLAVKMLGELTGQLNDNEPHKTKEGTDNHEAD